MGGVRSCRSRPLASVAFCLAVAAGCGLAEALPRVGIQPLGGFDRKLAERLASAVTALYQVQVEVLPDQPLPETAFYQPRLRYRAEKLLDWLDGTGSASLQKIVGLTSKDVSTTKGEHLDWGVFGLGSLGGRACVVSGFRLRKGGASQALYEQRLTKVTLHELGHTFGLEHCPMARCLMEDARGTVRTVDAEGLVLCEACQSRLGGLLRPQPHGP